MVVRNGALKLAKFLKIYVVIFQTDCWFEKKYTNIYVAHRTGTAPITNQYQVMNDGFPAISC